MHATRPLEDSNYGIRSIDSSFSEDGDNDEEGSDSSGGSTVHLDLSSSPSPSSRPPPPPQQQPPSDDPPVYGPQREPPLPGTTTISPLLESLPRGAFLGESSSSSLPPPPPRLPLPLPLLPPSLSTTSSPICLSPPLSPVNSYSSISSSSPPEMTNYLSDSVSSLGSLENDVSLSSSSTANIIGSATNEQQGGGEGSNGNLVLPTLPEGGLVREQERVELELRNAEKDDHGVFRIVVVAGKEKERKLLVERLALELGVELGEVEREGNEGREGRRGRTAWSSAPGGEVGGTRARDVWLASSGNDLTSVESLLEHVRSRHLPLSQQLSPREPPSLSTRDVLELAATGKGRGSTGWIDCCLIAVDEDSPSQSLSAARALSSFTPTLLVLLQSQSTTTLSDELSSSLQRLELVSPMLLSPALSSSSSPRSNLLLLDRYSLLPPSTTSDETGSEGLPTPQPGTADDPFSFPSQESSTFSEGLRTLFSTEKGETYLNRFAARGFMRSRAALAVVPEATPTVTSLPSTVSLSSSITSDSNVYPPRPRRRTKSSSTPTPLDQEVDEQHFDPLHLPSALSSLFIPSLRSITSFVLEGFAIVGMGMMSVVAQSVLVGVVGEVARRLDLRGAFVARTRWPRC
ncbi:hypothetical protein BDY24DRAFT_380643 [Mrakia frigida]|uniref:uncharacterized protein n=1 Tax=Mrakia frigida TaxID=29902 RepID=UPI003FCC21B7